MVADTDNQAFCYDEQNRLTWASSASGSIPCGGTTTAGSLTSAQYTYSLAYDAMNRLTYNIAGGGNYQYGTAGSVPLHGVTSTVTGGVTQTSTSYDVVGDMTFRAPTSAATCTGTVTGQQMTYDAERRMSHWQSSPSNPTSSADYLYDGSGNRVEQVDTTSGTSTKVYDLFGGLEEVSSSGSTSTLTKYYSAAGLLIGESVGGTISYLASDGLGSVSEALSTTGTVTAAQLYGPYGTVRYSSGTMPTAKGFTGQRADATSGLDYYGARYYDPLLGQFTTADTKQGPNRFAYVADDPETLTDPTEHCGGGNLRANCGGGGGGSGGGGGNDTCNASCYARYHHGGSHCGGCKVAEIPTTSATSSQCLQACKIANAKSIAGRTGWTFAYIGIALQGVVAILGAIGAALFTSAGALIASLFGIPEGVEVGALASQFVAFAAVLQVLVVDLGAASALFAEESNNADSWWTNSNLEGFRAVVLGVTGVFAAVSGAMYGIMSLVSKIPGGMAVSFSLQLASSIDMLGSLLVLGGADNAVDLEEAALQ